MAWCGLLKNYSIHCSEKAWSYISANERNHPMTKSTLTDRALFSTIDIASTAQFIQRVQKPSGEIPWSTGGKTDPWDHVESAMGLAVGGLFDEAEKAYRWSAETQLSDGSWWSHYEDGEPVADAYKDANMTAYIAVGIFHYYLSTGDASFLKQMWPTVCRTVDFITSLQGDTGGIYWAKRKDGSVDRRALLTGSSSIYMSLSSAVYIAELLGEDKTDWKLLKQRLGSAIRSNPRAFDRSKSRYAMDWYYPILSGAVTGREASSRIDRMWETFIIPGWGVRCVSDRPWVTIAETAELVVTLASLGRLDTAEEVFGWIVNKRYADGAFWTGQTYPDGTIYTIEKTSWTAAAALLANDVLYGFSPAAFIFSHHAVPESIGHRVSRNKILSLFDIVPN
jgi:MMP endo-(1,4)-3-O-methyl-alpha-D-mannosidase